MMGGGGEYREGIANRGVYIFKAGYEVLVVKI